MLHHTFFRHLVIFLVVLMPYTDIFSQCNAPVILGINRLAPNGIEYLIYDYSQPGDYYFEYGPVGFTPGNDANPGGGDTVIQFNSGFGVDAIDLMNAPLNITGYLRLQCSSGNWSLNSAPINYTQGGDTSPYIFNLPGLDFPVDIYFNLTNDPDFMSTCGSGEGRELRYRFDSPDTSYYEVSVSGYQSDGVPQFAFKDLNGITTVASYSCQTVDEYTTGGLTYIAKYSIGPLNKGTAYDLLFDANDTIPFDVTMKVVCPRPESFVVSNITSTAVDITWLCNCSDSIMLEYGLPGFVPGTGNAPGAGGTLVGPVVSPYTLSGLLPFTSYDVYFRSACGGNFSQNKKLKIKTAKDCSLATILACGDYGQFYYHGLSAVRGAWDIATCATPDSSEEVIYRFIPAQSGMHSLYVYNLFSNWQNYLYKANYYYKDASQGCNEQSWQCIGSSSSLMPNFTPQTFAFGPLTAGVEYYIVVDGPSFGTNTPGYTYYFQIQCVNNCTGPYLTAPTLVGINSAQINVVCNTCFTNGMLEYGPAGFTPGTGSTPGAGGTVISGVSFPYLLSGLDTNVTYDVYARSDCSGSGNGFSPNSGPVSFHTCATAPVSIISNTGLNEVCLGDSITLYQVGGAAGPGGQFVWYSTGCGNVLVGTGDSIRVAPAATTTFFVQIQSPCGTTQCASFPLIVRSLSVSGTTTLCQGQSTVLAANSGWASYQWSTGANTQSINVSVGGAYTVTVTGPSGCTRVATTVVTINPLPVPVITGNTDICLGDTAILNVGNYAAYLWNTGAFSSSLLVTVTGTYTITVTDNNGCTGSTSVTVTVHPLPAVTITAGGPTSFCLGGSVTLSAPASLTTWQWYRNNVPIAAAVGSTLVVTSGGWYYCVGGDAFGCESQSNSILVRVPCIPIDPPIDRELIPVDVTADRFLIFPNPGNGEFTITSPVKGMMEIYNSIGAIIFSQTISTTKTSIDISNHADGVYQVLFRSGTFFYSGKIVVLR